MRLSHITAVAGVLFSLTACGQGGFIRTVPQSFASADETDDFTREAAAKEIPVLVLGHAFGADQSTLETAVIARMRHAAWGVDPQFTAARKDSRDATYSMVFLVGGSGQVNGLALCTHPETVESTDLSAGDSMRLSGVLCRFGKTVMSVTAYADRIVGLDDPRFGALVAAATLDLTQGGQRSNRLKRDN